MEPQTIVVVEDNEPIARLIQEVLNDLPGYGAVTLHDGAHALDVIAAVRANLVILDIDLPDTSGLDLYDRLRHSPKTTAIPVLFMSAARHRDELARRDIHTFLGKPFDLDDLLDLVGRILASPGDFLPVQDHDAHRARRAGGQ